MHPNNSIIFEPQNKNKLSITYGSQPDRIFRDFRAAKSVVRGFRATYNSLTDELTSFKNVKRFFHIF